MPKSIKFLHKSYYMKYYLLCLLGLIFLLSSFDEKQEVPSANRCYSYYFYKCEYFYHLGELDSASFFLSKAEEYNDLLSVHYLAAAKIYLATGVMEKLHPTLIVMVNRGYNLNSLLSDAYIGKYLESNVDFRESLESRYMSKMKELDGLRINFLIDSLFELDQANRQNNLGKDLKEFKSVEKEIKQTLIREIIIPYGIPAIWQIGYESHGQLFILLMHNVTNDFGIDFNLMDVVEKAFVSRKFSALEYAAILDRKFSMETGFPKYAIWPSSNDGDFCLGCSVKNITKIDSVRFYSLGLGPLKYQAAMQNAVTPEDYKYQNFKCTVKPPRSNGLIDTIKLIND